MIRARADDAAGAAKNNRPARTTGAGRSPQKSDPHGITWHVAIGGTWTGSRPPYACRIEPNGKGSDPFAAFLVTLSRRGVRQPIATTEARTITLAKSWLTTQFRWLDARTPPPPAVAPARKSTFEVALHIDALDGQQLYQRLTRRMQAEAKRLGLSNPRRITTLIDNLTPGRPAEVWMCKGDPA